ncbi:MAG: hypothetical protein JW863_11995 [Chitinispirillaceae bacterium]|nr:hypothetical protein [Chitinispirillaceae bacterium]
MNDQERVLLNLVQHEFPLEKQPYASIAARLGITEVECIDLLRELNRQGILREIRPVINWRNAGFTGMLIGMTVDPERVDTVANEINRLPGVTHNYLREGTVNLWCTLTYGSDEEKTRHLTFMRELPGVRELKEFYSEKTYKIGLLLDLSSDGERGDGLNAGSQFSGVRCTGRIQTLPYTTRPDTTAVLQHLMVVQEPLHFSEHPFLHYAQQLEITEDEVLTLLRTYLSDGTIRRVAGVLKHNRAGFTDNAMVALEVENNRCDEAGETLAQFPFITHCYRRTSYPDWPYTMYAMVHARSPEEFFSHIGKIRGAVSCGSMNVLRSVKEFKKTAFRLPRENAR